jgi:hypothetical protein
MPDILHRSLRALNSENFNVCLLSSIGYFNLFGVTDVGIYL